MERLARGWSQKKVAERLGVSQAYVAMLEKGSRPLTERLARKFVSATQSSAILLPLPEMFDLKEMAPQQLAESLAALGYPGYAYLKHRAAKKHPAEVLLLVLFLENLEPRLVEALPWLLLKFWQMDFSWLVEQAKRHDLQNRLGFAAALARRMSAQKKNKDRSQKLAQLEATLERSRLASEDNFLRPARNEAERRWIRENRSEDARHWNLLTDLRPQHLAYDA